MTGKGEVRFSGTQEQTPRRAGATRELSLEGRVPGGECGRLTKAEVGWRETVTQSGEGAPGPRKAGPHLSWQPPSEQIRRQEAGGPG